MSDALHVVPVSPGIFLGTVSVQTATVAGTSDLIHQKEIKFLKKRSRELPCSFISNAVSSSPALLCAPRSPAPVSEVPASSLSSPCLPTKVCCAVSRTGHHL